MPRNVSEGFCYYHSQMCILYNSHLCSAQVKRRKHFENMLIQVISTGLSASGHTCPEPAPPCFLFNLMATSRVPFPSKVKTPKVRAGSTQQSEFYHSLHCSTSQAWVYKFFKHFTNLLVIPAPRVYPVLSQSTPSPLGKAIAGNLQLFSALSKHPGGVLGQPEENSSPRTGCCPTKHRHQPIWNFWKEFSAKYMFSTNRQNILIIQITYKLTEMDHCDIHCLWKRLVLYVTRQITHCCLDKTRRGLILPSREGH